MQTQTSTTGAVYYVRSSRDASKFYTVAENARGYLDCDCPAAAFYRSRPCKHVEQVRRGCGLRAMPKTWTMPRRPAPSPTMRDHVAALEV